MFTNMPMLVVYAAASFLFLAIIFRPLEMAFPAKPGQRFFRPAWFMDLCFFLGQYLLWNSVMLFLLLGFAGWLDGIVPASFRAGVAEQPFWLQIIEMYFLSDLFVYWGHRLQHRLPILCGFHSVHHSAEHLDWLAAHREHPIDTIYTMGLINLPAFMLGFPLQTLAAMIAFRGIWAIYIHSNVRLPIPFARWLIGAPELHHWHHDKDRNAGNYANISPLMDIIFGTYTCPDHEPVAFGIHEPTPKNYLTHMIHPLLPKNLQRHTAPVSPHTEPSAFPVVIPDPTPDSPSDMPNIGTIHSAAAAPTPAMDDAISGAAFTGLRTTR